METTEQDKRLPEEHSSFGSREAKQNDHDHDHEHDHEPEPKTNLNPDHQENQEDDGIDNATPTEPPQEPEPKSETEKDQEEEKEDDATATNTEESHPPPDFTHVCEEIDRFISALSSNQGEESDRPDVPEIIERFAFLVEAKITNYFDPSEGTTKWSHLTEDDSVSFSEAVDRVSKLMTRLCQFSSEAKYAPAINQIGGILQRAMSCMEDEFRSLLEDPKIPDPDHNNDTKTKQSSSSLSSSNSNQEADQSSPKESNAAGENNFPGYSDEVMSTLKKLAKAMISGGYETECFQVYIVARRTVLGETLRKLGFEKFSIDEVQKMQWESLEREIDSWNKLFKHCVAVYFTGERKLSEAVFPGDSSLADDLFSCISRSVMIELLNFAEAVAITKRSSEKLFKFLDLYETLRDVIPAMDDLFPLEIANDLKSETSVTRSRLGEAMVSIICELENSIKADTGKNTVPGGAVHPLTRYTMNYLKYACEYKETLEQVFREHQKIERADSATGSDYDYKSQTGQNQNNQPAKLSPFAIQINKVMDLLDANLETKSKLYKDTSLNLIFMMNNGRYISQKIKGSAEIHELMGDTWSRKRSSELRQYHKNYQRETWGRLLHCLTHEGLSVNGKVVKPVLKERFKSFNAMFDEIHKTQSAWVVSDEQLQSELRVSISAVVIPAYRSFLARFSQHFTPGRQTEKYIKYQPEDIETSIDELFDGNATPTGKRKP